MKGKTGMYQKSVKQWNPFQGCGFDCVYCEKSFKAQAKRLMHRCMKCYQYVPHEHPERLAASYDVPKTSFMEFVFTIASGDIAFCSTEYLQRIITKIKMYPETTFLLQSKNPVTFQRVKFPRNVLLGTTMETDDDELYKKEKISKAPLPSQRYEDFLAVDHRSKMITIEPVLKFGDDLITWVEKINPVVVWLGYESKGIKLPEPTKDEFWKLYQDIGKLHIPIILKKIKT